MDTSKLLGKVIGLYLLISGLWLIVQRSALEPMLEDFVRSPALIAMSARTALIVGLLMVVAHNRWTADWRVAITLLGWMILLSGVVSLFFPGSVDDMVQVTAAGARAVAYGIAAIAFGGFLGYRSLRT